MEFTGERYVPHIRGQIRYEHLHRYAIARSFSSAKRVLDVACGEGYGSALLAEDAAHVVGVDIDVQTVRHATRTYSPHHSNLEFAAGTCTALSLESHSFDVVVSFETIEHLADHELMLLEIKRVLRPGGTLIISSPNRKEYSESAHYQNPFHVKELDLAEFTDLLGRHFKYQRLFGQRIATASFVFELEDQGTAELVALEPNDNRGTRRMASLDNPTYFVAVCNDEREPIQRPVTSVLLDGADDIRRQYDDLIYQQVRDLTTELNNVRSDLNDKAVSAYAELAKVQSRLAEQSAELEAQHLTIHKLTDSLAQLHEREIALKRQAESDAENIATLQAEAQSDKRHVDDLQRSASAMRQELARVEAGGELLNSQLGEARKELSLIHNSRIWRLARAWYRLRALLAPKQSPRTITAAEVRRPDVSTPPLSDEQVHGLAPRVVFLSHDAYRAGAQIFLLNLLRWLKANSDVEFEVILNEDGELRSEFEALCPVTIWHDSDTGRSLALPVAALPQRVETIVRHTVEPLLTNATDRRRQTLARLKKSNVRLIYSNTLANGELLQDLAELKVPVISHAHELAYWITHKSSPTNNRLILQNTTKFVAASEATRQGLLSSYKLPADLVDVIHEFIPVPNREANPALETQIRKELNIPEHAFIVGGSGTTDWRKAPEIFVQLAQRLKEISAADVHFLWVGGANAGPVYGALEHDINRLGLSDRVHFVGARSNPFDYYQLFDVFALVSREDPFPLVMLEAASLGKPVVCFEASGGAPEFVSDDCGFVVPYLNTNRMAERVRELIESDALRRQLGDRAAQKVRLHYETSTMAPRILSLIKRFLTGRPSTIDSSTGLPAAAREDVLQRAAAASPGTTPKALFGDVDDQTWFWLHTQGMRTEPKLRKLLPSMPPEEVQLRFTGSAGEATLREAFAAYQLFRWIVGHWLNRPLETVLDFGCGWGRTIRFFLRDVEPQNLVGADCYPGMIDLCRETNRWSPFELVDPLPPSTLPDNHFDLIYCYSVFSHLSEAAHDKWLNEFSRVLRPGGILVATTWPRDFIIQCATIRANNTTDFWKRGPAKAFMDSDGALRSYDEGRFTHDAVGGGDVLDASFFGETCIPEAYVREHWAPRFEFLGYFTDRKLCPQNVIVVRKPDGSAPA